MKRERVGSGSGPMLGELRALRASGERSTAALELESIVSGLAAPSLSGAAREWVERVMTAVGGVSGRAIGGGEGEFWEAIGGGAREIHLQRVEAREAGGWGGGVETRRGRERGGVEVALEVGASEVERGDEKGGWLARREAVLSMAEKRVREKMGKEAETSREAFAGDEHKTVLVVRAPGMPQVRVMPCFPRRGANKLPLAKLLPHCRETPHRNAAIVEDGQIVAHAELLRSVFSANPSLASGARLAKEWASVQGLAPLFSGFHASMLLARLVADEQISALADAQTVFRQFLLFLSRDSSFEGGLFWPGDGMPESVRASFRASFEVVFVDPSGTVNLLWRLSRWQLSELQQLAASSLASLASSTSSLSALFSPRPPFSLSWDMLLLFDSSSVSLSSSSDLSLLLGPQTALLRSLCRLLARGLGSRALSLSHRTIGSQCMIGIRLDPSVAFRKLDSGPPAEDTAAASQFRSFWGSKAELRRFKDGSIVEAVVWEVPFESRQQIPEMIVRHLLQHHFSLAPTAVLGRQTDAVMFSGADALSLHISSLFNELGQKMRSLDQLPLAIAEVWQLDEVLRCCHPFPPPANPFCDGVSSSDNTSHSLAVRPVEMGLKFVSSSAWPKDRQAVRHLQDAFRIKLRQELARVHKIASVLQEEALDVLYKGHVFRVLLATGGKETKTMQMRASHSSALFGFHLKHNAFGATVSLCKRWLACHMLSDKIPPELVELITVAVFAERVPASPMFGFLRWLRLLSSFPWHLEPLVLSLNEADSPSFSAVESARAAIARSDDGRPYILSEQDPLSAWTRVLPSSAVWRRVLALAGYACAAVSLSSEVTRLFVPNTDDYSFVISLSRHALPSLWQSASSALSSNEPVVPALPTRGHPNWMIRPRSYLHDHSQLLIGYDPVRQFTSELQLHLGHLATFFFDEFGGSQIGVVLKNAPRHTMEQGAGLVCARPAKKGGGVEFNEDQFVATIRRMGGEAVKSIEKKTKKRE